MNFGIARVFLAITAFACSFGALRSYGAPGIILAVWIGTSVALICLMAKTNQVWPMLRTGLCTTVGLVAGCLPTIFTGPFSPTPSLVIVGGLVGFMVGIELTVIQQRKLENQHHTP